MSWIADLQLAFEQDGTATRLRRHGGKGPLYVQKPFYPEGSVCHVYLLHPPGGVAGGDSISFNADVQQDASVLFTTPAATKFLRTKELACTQKQTFLLAVDASAEWLPQETIVFSGSLARNETRVRLHPGATFVGCEVVALGRPANQEQLLKGSYTGLMRIESFCSSSNRFRTVFLDRQHYAGAGPELIEPWGLAGFPVTGTLVATPADADVLACVREVIGRDKSPVQATLIDEVLVVRALGNATAQVQTVLRKCWAALRPLLIQRPANAPAIWRT